jgi:FAD/FMN-containing dehydrogenase
VKRREFIKEVGNIALTVSSYSLLAQGMFLNRAHGAPVPLDGLRRIIRPEDGVVVGPNDANFAKVKNGFNLRIQALPSVVVRCATPEGVMRAVGWARENGVAIRLRSGGHSYEGFSTGDGCLIIDVNPMSRIAVSDDKQTARIGSGARLGKVYETLFSKGVIIPAGSCATVGVAGLAQGGGFGLSSRKLGLTCDNVLSMQMVDVNGKLVTASASENPDLYWALRGGGGGNMGVVTDFQFKVHPMNKVITFVLKWPSARAKEVIQAWQRTMPNAPDELTCILKLSGSSQTGLGEVRCVGQFTARDTGGVPRESDLVAALKPLVSQVTPSAQSMTLRTFTEAAQFFSGGEDPPVAFKAKSDYAVEPLSPQGIDSILNALKHMSMGAVAVIFDCYGGAVNRVASDATAFAHRAGTLHSVQYYCQWGSASATAGMIKMMREVHGASHPFFSGGAYVNYCDLDIKDWQSAYFGDNYRRLTEVKRAWDPEYILNFGPQSIPPA